MKSQLFKSIVFGSALFLAACSDSTPNSSNSTSTNLDQGVPAPIVTENFKGFINSGVYENQQVLSVDLDKGEFLVSVPLGRNVALSLADTPISQVPGAHAYTSTLTDGTKVLVLAIPIKYSSQFTYPPM